MKKRIVTFYNEKQVNFEVGSSFSKSPLKPKLVVDNINSNSELKQFFEYSSDFKPFCKKDFKIAHTRNYINAFFKGEEDIVTSNSIPWSTNLAESVRYTNASLYNAIKASILNPELVCFSPTSGFHHAQPNKGSRFCTFSGQVIASVKLWREFRVKGAYLDLDGHFGNSIEDSRTYVKDLNLAIPIGFNFNPQYQNNQYVKDLLRFLTKLERKIETGEIHYIVWCHGADSHEHDDVGGGCNTEHWLKCSEVFYSWLSELEYRLNKHIPLTLSLFGGYRRDDYQSVINLHLMDLGKCVKYLINEKIDITLPVKDKH